MKQEATNSIDEKLRNEAVQWDVRIKSDTATDADWVAFVEWLEADSLHRQAYDAVEDIAIAIDEGQTAQSQTAQEQAAAESPKAAAPDVKTPPVATASNVIDASHRFGRAKTWAMAAMAIAATLMLAVGLGNFGSTGYRMQEFATGQGEQRLVELADGSTVRLNTNSKIKVMFDGDTRRTQLAYGQAIYSVAKDADRPFYVEMGESAVRVVGTKFDILRHNNKVQVTVAEGIVEFSPDQQAPEQEKPRLTVGAQLVHTEGTSDVAITHVDAGRFLAWQEGRLEYENAPLADVVADLNRYFPKPIRLTGNVGTLKFSGVIRTANEQDALLMLASGLPVHIETLADEIVISASSETD